MRRVSTSALNPSQFLVHNDLLPAPGDKDYDEPITVQATPGAGWNVVDGHHRAYMHHVLGDDVQIREEPGEPGKPTGIGWGEVQVVYDGDEGMEFDVVDSHRSPLTPDGEPPVWYA